MRTISSLIAVVALLGAVALTPVLGGVILGFVLLAVFLLALFGAMAGLEDRTVRPRNASMDPTGWRNGS